MVKDYWKIRNDSELNDKGVYIISTKKLAKKNLYKVGYSGVILKNRLKQINDILSPALQEPLMIYGLIVPKAGKSGMPQNVKAKELNEIEKIIHKLYQKEGLLEVFPGSKNYSEWIREESLQELFDFLKDTFDDPINSYSINFKILNWNV